MTTSLPLGKTPMGDMWEGFLQTAGMDSTPGVDDLQLRNSTIGSWDLCPGRVGYAQSEGYEPTPSEAMSWGSMGHAAIETDLTVGLHLWTMGEMEALWRESLLDEPSGPYDLYELASKEKIKASVEEALVMMAAWQANVLGQLGLSDNILIEEKLYAPLGVLPNGRAVWFHGTPDLVDLGNRKITDWKTTGRPWKETKVLGLYGPQAYSWLVEQNHSDFISDHEFYVYARTKQEWVLHETTRDRDDVESYLRKAWMIAKSIDAQAFPFTPWSETFGNVQRGWHCSPKYCSAWNICEGKHLPDDLMEETPIDIKAGWA